MNDTAITSGQTTISNMWQWLENVCDPEIPVLSVLDMGVVRRLLVKAGGKEFTSSIEGKENAEMLLDCNEISVQIDITPTYTGCPAMNMIGANIRLEFLAHGIENTTIQEVLTPAWTTDWIPDSAREKLREYGIAPPANQKRAEKLLFSEVQVACPHCGSAHTEQISAFGSTACKSLYRCLDCREPFDYFKCH